MPETILVRFITPSGAVRTINAAMVNIPATTGMVGIMPGHTDFITNVSTGLVTVFSKQKEKSAEKSADKQYFIAKYFIAKAIIEVRNEAVTTIADIIADFVMDIAETDKSKIMHNIAELQGHFSFSPKENLQNTIIEEKIHQLEQLMNFLN